MNLPCCRSVPTTGYTWKHLESTRGAVRLQAEPNEPALSETGKARNPDRLRADDRRTTQGKSTGSRGRWLHAGFSPPSVTLTPPAAVATSGARPRPNRLCVGGSAALVSGRDVNLMNPVSLEGVRSTLLEVGIDVFRVDADAVHLAERVRSHLMDAGVRVRFARQLGVDVTVRAQRSDYPSDPPEKLFARVREAVTESAEARGFKETSVCPRELRDPVDDTRLLDVWYELTFSKDSTLAALIDDVRWALGLPKCVSR